MSRPLVVTNSRSLLKAAFSRFQSLEGIKQLQICLVHLISLWRELLAVPDRESDAVHRDTCLVRQFKFHRCWPGLHLAINHRENLTHNVRIHKHLQTDSVFAAPMVPRGPCQPSRQLSDAQKNVQRATPKPSMGIAISLNIMLSCTSQARCTDSQREDALPGNRCQGLSDVELFEAFCLGSNGQGLNWLKVPRHPH